MNHYVIAGTQGRPSTGPIVPHGIPTGGGGFHTDIPIGYTFFAIPFTGRISARQKSLRKVSYAPMRGAFLALVRMNVWGMASALNKINSIQSANPPFNGNSRLGDFWHNAGGDFNKLRDAWNAGKGKKAHMFLAPRKLKDAYSKFKVPIGYCGDPARNMSGYPGIGGRPIGSVTLSSLIASAGAILLNFVNWLVGVIATLAPVIIPALVQAFQADKDSYETDFETYSGLEDFSTQLGPSPEQTTFGMKLDPLLLIGILALGTFAVVNWQKSG